jgi:hypothetical protein
VSMSSWGRIENDDTFSEAWAYSRSLLPIYSSKGRPSSSPKTATSGSSLFALIMQEASCPFWAVLVRRMNKDERLSALFTEVPGKENRVR